MWGTALDFIWFQNPGPIVTAMPSAIFRGLLHLCRIFHGDDRVDDVSQVEPHGPKSTRHPIMNTENRVYRIWMTFAAAQALWHSLWKFDAPMDCATERNSPEATILVHCDTIEGKIYRFAPHSKIEVSIDRDSFRRLTDSQRDLLRQGLQLTITTINNYKLGITFEYVEHKRGLVELEYRGYSQSTWAISEFPVPGREKYTIGIYSRTFEAPYGPVILGVLSHEMSHLLGMRHHFPHPREPRSVLYGSIDAKSIMGLFHHPAELRFHLSDELWLRNFYSEKVGKKLGGMTIEDVHVTA